MTKKARGILVVVGILILYGAVLVWITPPRRSDAPSAVLPREPVAAERGESEVDSTDKARWKYSWEPKTGVRLVRHEVPGTVKTLYHIKTVHFNGDRHAVHNKEYIAAVAFLNDQVYQYLAEEGVKVVYAEGFSPTGVLLMTPEKLRDRIKRTEHFKYRFDPDSIKDRLGLTMAEIKGRGFLRAEFRLALEKKLQVRQAEKNEILLQAEEVDEKYRRGEVGPAFWAREIYDVRENAILGSLAEWEGTKVYLIMGAGHDFTDNVSRWNKENPKSRVSLIDVIPMCYDSMLAASETGVLGSMRPRVFDPNVLRPPHDLPPIFVPR